MEDYYEITDNILGEGFFGKVFPVTHKATGEKRALKVLSKLQIDENQIELLRSEVEISRSIDHPNLIKVYEVFETRTDVMLAMELCTGGDLFHEIMNQEEWERAPWCFTCCPLLSCLYFDGNNQRDKRAYSEKDAAGYVRQIMQGVAYLHDKNIVHCDLHMKNILFANPKLNAPIKLIDFGLSQKLMSLRPEVYLSDTMGVVQYQAPEMLKGKYRQPCDMWSIGVITFHLLFGYRPFNFDKDKIIRARQVREHIRDGFQPVVLSGQGAWFPAEHPISDAARDFIKHLLMMDPVDRISAREALKHPWLTGNAASAVPISTAVLDNMRQQRDDYKLERTLLLRMGNLLEEDELKQLEIIFSQLDYTHDGMITLEELSSVINVLHKKKKHPEQAEKELNKLSRALAKSSSAQGPESVSLVSYEDMLSGVLYQKLVAKKERLWRAFDELDADQSGRVHLSELISVVGEKTARELMTKYDKDGLGLNIDEFLSIWEVDSKKEIEQQTPANVNVELLYTNLDKIDVKNAQSVGKHRKSVISLNAQSREDHLSIWDSSRRKQIEENIPEVASEDIKATELVPSKRPHLLVN